MKEVQVKTYKAEITIGMKEGYSGPIHTQEEVLILCQDYCNKIGLGVEVHFGTCVYVKGSEPCVRIGLINYPRFPSTNEEIFNRAKFLGTEIAAAFKQQRFSIVATDVTVMVEM